MRQPASRLLKMKNRAIDLEPTALESYDSGHSKGRKKDCDQLRDRTADLLLIQYGIRQML